MKMPNYLEKTTYRISENFAQHRVAVLFVIFFICLAVYFFLAFGLEAKTSEKLFSMLPSALNTMVGIGVTVLITTFSFVFVALALVSAQFSPRLIRHFWQGDNFRRFFLWSFIFTFAFCFAVQFFDFPRIQLLALTLGFYLIFVMFPIFLSYLAENINVATITRHIAKVTVSEIKENYEVLPALKETISSVIKSKGKGYLDTIDSERLIKVFSRLKKSHPEISMQIPNYIGSFIEEMSALAIILPSIEIDRKTSDEIGNCFLFSRFRSIDQDVEYGIRQLADIGIKAISPAVNDPTTCVNCLNYLGVIVKSMALHEDKSLKAQELERNGIFLREPSFEKIVDDAFNQIYQWGKKDYVIVKTIIRILADIISVVPNEQRFKAILQEIDEMELSYLYDKKQVVPIQLKEHRDYVEKSLKVFYETAAKQAEILNLTDEPKRLRLLAEKL
jgi:uncharacterized membrane protein